MTKIEVPIPKIDSKLSNMVAGILTSKEKPVQVSMIAHVNPLDKNYEDALITLMYQDKIKQSLVSEQKNKSDGPYAEHFDTLERLYQRVTKEHQGLMHQYHEYQATENEDFQEL